MAKPIKTVRLLCVALCLLSCVSTASPVRGEDHDSEFQAIVSKARIILSWRDDSVAFFVCAFDPNDLVKFRHTLSPTSEEEISRLREVVEQLENGNDSVGGQIPDIPVGRDHVGDVAASEEKEALHKEVQDAFAHCPNGKPTLPLPPSLVTAIQDQFNTLTDASVQPHEASMNGVALSFKESNDPLIPNGAAPPNETIMISPTIVRTMVLTCTKRSRDGLQSIVDQNMNPHSMTLADNRSILSHATSPLTSGIAAILTGGTPADDPCS